MASPFHSWTARARWPGRLERPPPRLRAIEARRLELMGEKLWERFDEGGDLKAGELWHRNRAQYCKLLGLDLEVRAPEQHLHIHEPVVQAFDRDIARLLRERATAAGQLEAGVIDGEASDA